MEKSKFKVGELVSITTCTGAGYTDRTIQKLSELNGLVFEIVKVFTIYKGSYEEGFGYALKPKSKLTNEQLGIVESRTYFYSEFLTPYIDNSPTIF